MAVQDSVYQMLNSTYEPVCEPLSQNQLSSIKVLTSLCKRNWISSNPPEPCTKFLKPLFNVCPAVRVMLLYQDESTGLPIGADTLCRAVLFSFYKEKHLLPASFECIENFDVLGSFYSEGRASTISELYPQILETHSESSVEDWCAEANILLFIIDWLKPTALPIYQLFNEGEDAGDRILPSDSEKTILENVYKIFRKAKIILMTDSSYAEEFHSRNQVDDSIGSIVKAKLSIDVSNSIDKIPSFYEDIRALQEILGYPPKIKDTKPTYGEILWWQIENSLKGLSEEFNLSKSEEENILLNVSYVAYQASYKVQVSVITCDIPLYLKPILKKFLLLILIRKQKLFVTCEYQYSFVHEIQREILAAYYIFRDSRSVMTLMKELKSKDTICAYVVGHLYRGIKRNTLIPLDDIMYRRTLKNIFLLSESSSDRTFFLLKVVEEMHCDLKLSDTFLKEAVFPKQLEIFDNSLLLEPLKYLVEISNTEKVMIILKHDFDPNVLHDTLDFLSDRQVCLGFAIMSHLEWDCGVNSDRLLHVVTKLSSKCFLEDFIGSLTEKCISSVIVPEILPYLTCLRVRVSTAEAAVVLLERHKHLKNLMWLEVDFDLPIEETLNLPVSPTTSRLCDLSFKNIEDAHIPQLVRFLVKLRQNYYDYYSGIHIHNSFISVLGCIQFLKELKLSNMKLSAPLDVVTKYRKWRYRELRVLTNDELLDFEKVYRLLGSDDRHQYSDNEIRSFYSCKDGKEIRQLSDFIKSNEDIMYFDYSCQNMQVRKMCDGDVITS